MMNSTTTYLLSVIDHKSTHQIQGTDITLLISKSMENNFRERNPQLGRVEAVGEDNPLNLSVGDTVAVNHRTFYHANVGPDKSFLPKEFVEHDGVKIFRAELSQILFKYNNHKPELLPGQIICSGVEERKILGFDTNTGEFIWSKEFVNEGTVLYGNDKFQEGKKILVSKFGFYLVTLDGVDYFKVHENQVVAFVENGEAIPTPGNSLVKYDTVVEHAFLDLSHVKPLNNITATDTNGNRMQVWRNNGVEWNGHWIINEEMIVWRWKQDIPETAPFGERITL